MATRCYGQEPPSLQHGLAVLAEFENERVGLHPTDIERLVDLSSSTARRCLAILSGLGYLSRDSDGCYRLAGSPTRLRAGPSEGGAAGASA